MDGKLHGFKNKTKRKKKKKRKKEKRIKKTSGKR